MDDDLEIVRISVDSADVLEVARRAWLLADRLHEAHLAIGRLSRHGVVVSPFPGRRENEDVDAAIGACLRSWEMTCAQARRDAGSLRLAGTGYATTEALSAALFHRIDAGVSTLAGELASRYAARPPAEPGAAVDLGSRPRPTGIADLIALAEIDGPANRIDVWAAQDGTGEPPTYIVVLPGTSRLNAPGVDPGEDLRDMGANFALMSGRSTAELAGLADAVAAAGVPPSARLVLVGHSQGGLTAVRAASGPLAGRVDLVVTAGSPVAGMADPPGVTTVSLEHRADPVPSLDGRANTPTPGRITVRFGAGLLLPPIASTSPHALSIYREGARRLDGRRSPELTGVRARLGRLSGDRWSGRRVDMRLRPVASQP